MLSIRAGWVRNNSYNVKLAGHRGQRFAPRSVWVREDAGGSTFPDMRLKNQPEQGIDRYRKEARRGSQSLRSGWEAYILKWR